MRGAGTIHASCVALGGKGVLLLGGSGAGKSDLALRLIDDGARLVADDRCELFLRRGRLRVRAPASIRGLLELRGIGLIALPALDSAPLHLAVRLGGESKRLPEPAFYAPPADMTGGAPVPLIRLDGAASAAPARIRAALAAFSRGLFRDTFNTR